MTSNQINSRDLNSSFRDDPPKRHKEYPAHYYDTRGLLASHRLTLSKFRDLGFDMIDRTLHDTELRERGFSGVFKRISTKMAEIKWDLDIRPNKRITAQYNHLSQLMNEHGDFIWELNLFVDDDEFAQQISKLPKFLANMVLIDEIRVDLPYLQSLEFLPAILHIVTIYNCNSLTSLEFLPSALRFLTIEQTPLHSFFGYPSTAGELRNLAVDCCPLHNFYGLPHILPHLKRIFLIECPIQTFAHFPDLPALTKFNVGVSPPIILRNYLGLIPLIRQNLADYFMSISLHGISPNPYDIREALDSVLRTIQDHQNNDEIVPPSYFKIFEPYLKYLKYGNVSKALQQVSDDEILALKQIFASSPYDLAQKYIRLWDSGQISQFEQDRIIYEGTPEILHFLVGHLGPNDAVVQKLAKSLQISPSLGNFML